MRNRNRIRRIGSLSLMLAAIFSILLVSGCGTGVPASDDTGKIVVDMSGDGNAATISGVETENPLVAMDIKGYGTIIIELYPHIAPETVNNFIYLVKTGFYDNNTIHRLQKGFVLQGGDPEGSGYGGPGYSIKGEFSLNGFNNSLKHEYGVISMARSSNGYDTAGSQFFIMLGTADYLDGAYAAFGSVVQGMDIVDRIAATEKIANLQTGKLVNNLTITKAVVDTRGKEYADPVKIEKAGY